MYICDFYLWHSGRSLSNGKSLLKSGNSRSKLSTWEYRSKYKKSTTKGSSEYIYLDHLLTFAKYLQKKEENRRKTLARNVCIWKVTRFLDLKSSSNTNTLNRCRSMASHQIHSGKNEGSLW